VVTRTIHVYCIFKLCITPLLPTPEEASLQCMQIKSLYKISSVLTFYQNCYQTQFQNVKLWLHVKFLFLSCAIRLTSISHGICSSSCDFFRGQRYIHLKQTHQLASKLGLGCKPLVRQ